MSRFTSLIIAAACLFALAGCGFLSELGNKPDNPDNTSAAPEANNATPGPGANGDTPRQRFTWDPLTRMMVPDPPTPGNTTPPPDGTQPQPDDRTQVNSPPGVVLPKDELVKLIEAVADTPESRRLIEAVLQTMADKPDKAFALLKDENLKDKQMLVNLLRAYVEMQLGDSDNAVATLDQAFRDLRSQMPLRVSSPEFCRKVQSFGKYDVFTHRVFRPSDQVILYFEPQYFTCKQTGDDYAISLNVRYTINDASGKQVWQKEQTVDHTTTRYLYDLFLTQFIQMPSLPEGNYTLKIELQDNLSEDQYRAESVVGFEIRNL